jgi:ammonia channel protein AmtB
VFGFGSWFVSAEGLEMGPVFTTFLFQLSFATTATTIVSGSVAER